ncbi:MAG: hypothetical protein QOH84_4780, partial [Kribbellaceae bacterium]|nr:hypothetical protein [Kribbellaceae bacterium]
MAGYVHAGALAGLAAVFIPADPPRDSSVAFWDPSGGDLPLGVGEQSTHELVVKDGDAFVTRTTRAIELPIDRAVPVLGRIRTTPGAHPASAFWGAASLIALQLVARGRLLPGVSPAGHDAWRAGPLDPTDVDRILKLAEAIPFEARCLPLPRAAEPATSPAGADRPTPQPTTEPMRASDPAPSVPTDPALRSAVAAQLRVPVGEDLVRQFIDAVADGMPRSPGAVMAHGTALFAAKQPQQASRLRGWADEVSAGLDTGVRISLRIELPESLGFRAVVQLHSLKDPTLVRDAADVWAEDVSGFGPRARIDATLAIRRASRVWSPLNRLLDSAVPDRLELADEDVAGLLATGAQRLAAAGVELHWPRSL